MVNWKGEANIVQGLMGSIAGSRDEGRCSWCDVDMGGTTRFDRWVGEDSTAVGDTGVADR